LDRFCPRCGKAIHDDAAVFCPYCSASLIPVSPPVVAVKRSGFPITSGILTIIAACITIIIGIIGILVFAVDFNNYYYYGPLYQWVIIGIFGILGFAFGLTGGIYSLKRKHFAISVVGTSFVLLSGFVTMISLGTDQYGDWGVGLVFGLPVILLSILGIIFLGVSRGEFA